MSVYRRVTNEPIENELWCPSSLAKLVQRTPISLGCMANITVFVGNSNKPITGGHHPACKIIWDDFDIGIHIGIHIHGGIRFMLKGSIMGKKQYGIMGFSLRHLLVNVNKKNMGKDPHHAITGKTKTSFRLGHGSKFATVSHYQRGIQHGIGILERSQLGDRTSAGGKCRISIGTT